MVDYMETLCEELEDCPYLHLFIDSYKCGITTLRAAQLAPYNTPCIVVYYNKLNPCHNLPQTYGDTYLVYKHLDFSSITM